MTALPSIAASSTYLQAAIKILFLLSPQMHDKYDELLHEVSKNILYSIIVLPHLYTEGGTGIRSLGVKFPNDSTNI